MAQSDETRLLRQVTAAGAERTELVAEHDAQLLRTAAEFRKTVSWADLSEQELRLLATVAGEWAALADQRLEHDAQRASLTGKILAAAAALPADERLTVLRAQLAVLQSLTSSTGAAVEMLDATAKIAEKLRG